MILLGLFLSAASADAFDHRYETLKRYLPQVVSGNLVDYEAARTNRELLDRFLAGVREVTAKDYATWDRQEQLAFWINTYNALVITTILERPPAQGSSPIGLFFPKDSIWRIPGVWKRVHFETAGEPASLKQIEHGILREQFQEPRIHFALNCASIGCPALRAEPYLASRLDRQLDEQTRGYLRDTERGFQWVPGSGTVHVSKLFQWFRKDFRPLTSAGPAPEPVPRESREKQPLQFILQHLAAPTAKALEGQKRISVKYLDYDWSLNAVSRP